MCEFPAYPLFEGKNYNGLCNALVIDFWFAGSVMEDSWIFVHLMGVEP